MTIIGSTGGRVEYRNSPQVGGALLRKWWFVRAYETFVIVFSPNYALSFRSWTCHLSHRRAAKYEPERPCPTPCQVTDIVGTY